jgi:hypothetical protein
VITIHQQMRELMPDRIAGELAPGDAEWVDLHLQSCAECSNFRDSLLGTVAGVRREIGRVVASGSMVRRTQSGVRRAAVQMQKREERMSALWIACVIAGLWALLSIPLIWEGTRWLGGHTSVPNYVWQTVAIFLWLMPAGLAVGVGVWSRGGLRLSEQ